MASDDFNEAEYNSTDSAAYTKLLESKANIVKAQKKQKGCYDNRHYIKSSYTYLCTYTGRYVTYIYLLTSIYSYNYM